MTENQTSAAKTTTTRACNCGCGESTSSSKTFYRPGHDARHAGMVARDFAAYLVGGGEGTSHSMLDELGTEALRLKARKMAERLVAKAAAPQDRKAKQDKKASEKADKKAVASLVAQEEAAHAEQEAAKRAEAEAAIQEDEVHGTVRVGRWSYPAIKTAAGVVKNTKRDGSGEWEATGREFTAK